MGRFVAPPTLSPRRRVLTLHPRKHRVFGFCWGFPFSFWLDPGRFWDSFCVKFHAIEMHNYLPLPIALLYSIRATVQSLQHLVGAFRFPAYFGTPHHLQPDSVIWFVHGASDVFVVPIFLALLFHASSPAYITVQAIQVLAKMPNVLAGDLLYFPSGWPQMRSTGSLTSWPYRIRLGVAAVV
ncbi:hypothetical protein T07_1981 [Trichinella nelsoni]|uniref:Uncharacterized protein n=1 Tax=Trichinella nelsoni TaxID=6336 RepID=A0A0V0SE31_9BILA|nr:hypothetical protein T07_1981 [Trichinella nelsoni]